MVKGPPAPLSRAQSRAAVTNCTDAAKPSCGTCGSTWHYDAKCWVTYPKEALTMYPEYSGPSDPQLHEVYVQACRRQGLVPRAYHLHTQPAAANIIHHRHRARRLPAAHDRHCAERYDALEYDRGVIDSHVNMHHASVAQL
jgi:hypothetical protein